MDKEGDDPPCLPRRSLEEAATMPLLPEKVQPPLPPASVPVPLDVRAFAAEAAVEGRRRQGTEAEAAVGVLH